MSSIDELAPLVGDWQVTATFSDPAMGTLPGRQSLQWGLNGQFLLQYAEADHPAAPTMLGVIAVAPGGDGFLQHYFDSRGVVRQYTMTFGDNVWTLAREAEPPDFCQRFRGELSADGAIIAAAWHRTDNGEWLKDFDLLYERR
jgi:hypothetical protein